MSTLQQKWSINHIPWTLPKLPWVMHQSWNNVLFMHYPIKLETLRELVPQALPLDSYDGWGWISVVPFKMENVWVRGLPGSLAFPELNVRTYVKIDNKPGVYFLSLDATHQFFVWFSNTFCYLPYFLSDMEMNRREIDTHFVSKRIDDTAIQLNCSYKPCSEPFVASKGSFDEWLTERYCFYTLNSKGRVYRCNILHQPWELQQVQLELQQDTILLNQNIQVEPIAPIIHYSKGVDVRIWPLLKV